MAVATCQVTAEESCDPSHHHRLTLPSAISGGEDRCHVLAALDHAHGVVLGQAEVDAKTNEITMFTTLLDRIEINGAVITADALHAQREHARYLARRGAQYVITVKGNQPGLHAQLAACPGGSPSGIPGP